MDGVAQSPVDGTLHNFSGPRHCAYRIVPNLRPGAPFKIKYNIYTLPPNQRPPVSNIHYIFKYLLHVICYKTCLFAAIL